MNGTRVLAIVFVALLVLGVLSAAWAPSSRAIGQWLESQAHNMNKIHAQRLRVKRQ